MKRSALTFALILSISSGITNQAFALNGQRKGFLIGIGVGPGLTSFNQSWEGGGRRLTSDREKERSLMTDFRIGYAPSNRLQLYWMSKVSWFGTENGFGDKVTIANGFGGLGATYSFNERAPSPFVTAGVGFSTWGTPLEQGTDTMMGTGVVLGAGYEFSKHWSFELDLMWGEPRETQGTSSFSTNALSLKFTLNVLAY